MSTSYKTKIEWTDYTLNPIIGCQHGCSYCYAKALNDRFHFIKDWTKPEFFPERLYKHVASIKHPSKIFVGSMSDVFGAWVPDFWIAAILEMALMNSKHTFQFLTKNPSRYQEFHCLTDPTDILFVKNAWLGMTVDSLKKDTQKKIDEFKTLPTYKFISFEPLLSDMSGLDLKGVDLIIIGAMTGTNAIKPQKEWVDSLISYAKKNGIEVFLKSNLNKI